MKKIIAMLLLSITVCHAQVAYKIADQVVPVSEETPFTPNEVALLKEKIKTLILIQEQYRDTSFFWGLPPEVTARNAAFFNSRIDVLRGVLLIIEKIELAHVEADLAK